MEYDSETGNYYDHARYYNPRLGRFMSPDPGNAGASPGNPQSWNGYSYVLNNPETLTDPLGLCGGTGEYPDLPCPIGTSVTVTASAPSGVPQALFLENVLEKFSHAALPLQLHSSGMMPLLADLGHVATCASSFADRYSMAGGLHALGMGRSGIGGFVTEALGGNAFSGVTNLIASFASGAAGGHNVFYNMALSVMEGPSQGVLPGLHGAWGSSVSELTTQGIARVAWSSVTGAGQSLVSLTGEASLASTGVTAAEFASGVAEAEYAYDALSYATGLFACAAK